MHSQSQGTSPVLSQQGTGPIKRTTGTVTEILECGQSYMIQGPNSRVYRRNRAHLKPYVMMAPPFKTIQQKKGRNSPKTFPFKTISPARPNPCLSRRKPAIWTPDPCCLMTPTHMKHPQHHPQGTTHLDHHHAHPQHHSHPENHLWSPVQRTPHLKAGRDTSLNQLSSDPMTLTKDSHMDFQPC